MHFCLVWFSHRKVGWVEGMDVVRKMEAVGSEDGDTSKPVVIKACEMAK